MSGRWRVSILHMIAFTGGLLIVLGVLVHSTIERVNQLDLVSSQTVLAAADAVAAAIEGEVRAGAWGVVQERLRAMASPRLRLRYRVVGADGAVLADSERIRAGGRLETPPAAVRPYELAASLPLAGSTSSLVVEANWERQYLEARRAIEREAVSAAIVLMALVIGAFVALWRLGVRPLHRLREAADAMAAGRPDARTPDLRLADLHAIGEALERLNERAAGLAESNRRLRAEAGTLTRDLEDVDRAREAAEAANSAKSDFLARMSHDLRTPLHGIIGFAEMIRDQMVGPVGTSKYVDYARDIHHSGVHLLRLINDVLDLSKIEAGRFELVEDSIPVWAVVEEAAHAVSPIAEQKGLVLTVSVAPSLPMLIADEKTLRQMLFNLLSNAIKFTEPGGSVSVMAGLSDHGLDIVVADTGMGIGPEEIDLVFTEFGQAGNPRTRPAEGTGLGLVIVRSLIELHGGRLVLESEPGRGTSVTLAFPAFRIGGRLGVATNT